MSSKMKKRTFKPNCEELLKVKPTHLKPYTENNAITNIFGFYSRIQYSRFYDIFTHYTMPTMPLLSPSLVSFLSPQTVLLLLLRIIFMCVQVGKQRDRDDSGRKHASTHLFSNRNCFVLFCFASFQWKGSQSLNSIRDVRSLSLADSQKWL